MSIDIQTKKTFKSATEKYKYGFITDIESDRAPKGLNESIVRLISSKKNVLISAHGNSIRALCKKLFYISKKKIIDFEIPTGNPLLIRFKDNLKVKDCKYLDYKRAKKILFNV